MKNTMFRSLSIFGISLMMALSVAAQDEPKIKTSEKENKYKSEDLKIKEKKDETKYKTDDVKIKDKKDETKYKSEDLKIKDKKDERKVKADNVKPMRATSTVRTTVKTGETQVRTKEHVEAVTVETTTTPDPVVAQQVAVPAVPAPVKKTPVRKYTAKKSTPRKTTTTTTPNTNKPKYIVRTKVVRDTVYVPSPPERIVTTQKEYVHDTVTITRVDTVVKVQTQNTYTGYQVPKGNFKKVKLKRDKDDGTVKMKRKEKD